MYLWISDVPSQIRSAGAPLLGAPLPYPKGRIETYSRHTLQFHDMAPLAQPVGHYLEQLYIDTVCYHIEALDYCYRLLGPERILFGTDHPFGNYTLKAELVEQLDCPAADKERIYSGNATALLRL